MKVQYIFFSKVCVFVELNFVNTSVDWILYHPLSGAGLFLCVGNFIRRLVYHLFYRIIDHIEWGMGVAEIKGLLFLFLLNKMFIIQKVFFSLFVNFHFWVQVFYVVPTL